MPDFLLSLVRTYVPIAVGALATWLASIGLDIDTDTRTGLVVAATGIITAAYYLLARLLERHVPAFGLLLGARTAPTYTAAATEAGAGEERGVADVADPVEADTSGDAVDAERLDTSTLQALTPEVLAQMDREPAEHRA